ncbi:MAG TPA: hypothetical protein VJP80_07960 [Candidatus Saccharimonadales bacterium]|nr:hypothetical protein [Candidatus Saccharimonadales bacterium]
MDSVGDILQAYGPSEPSEIVAIKRYIADEFGAESSVGLQGEALVITVASASLANALRLRLLALQKAAGTTKRLLFRIG